MDGIKENGGRRNCIRKVMKKIDFILGDACKLQFPDKSIDLVITRPPYIGVETKRYGGEEQKQINYNQNIKKYIKLLTKATLEMERVLKDSGSIVIALPHTMNTPYHYITSVLKKTNLTLGNPPFIVSYVDFIESRNYMQKENVNTEYGFWFHLIKNPEKIYHNPFIIKRYSQKSCWEIPWYPKDKVSVELKKHGFIEDAYNPEIAKRLIEMFTKKGHTVLDPFGGSGVGPIEAYKLGRSGIVLDISQEQLNLAKKRFEIEGLDK